MSQEFKCPSVLMSLPLKPISVARCLEGRPLVKNSMKRAKVSYNKQEHRGWPSRAPESPRPQGTPPLSPNDQILKRWKAEGSRRGMEVQAEPDLQRMHKGINTSFLRYWYLSLQWAENMEVPIPHF